MKKHGLSHIRSWMWLYLIIVVLTTMAAFVLIYNEISSTLELYASHVQPGLNDPGPTVHALLNGAKLRLALLLTTTLAAVFLLSVLWLRSAFRQINRPIQKIQRAVSQLAQGKLNETVDIAGGDEFGQIGTGINELAANLQELLLYIWKQTGQCIRVIEQVRRMPGDDRGASRRTDDELIQRMAQLSEAIENLREMAQAFVFYDVHLFEEQALAINRPGEKAIGGDASQRNGSIS